MTVVVIKSPGEPAELRLGPARDAGEIAYYGATLKSAVLAASVEVCDLAPNEHLVAFFSALGDAWWTGWDDERVFSSLEGHLVLAATRDRLGHIQLRATLRDGFDGAEWTASGTLELDAGQLPGIAADVRELFG